MSLLGVSDDDLEPLSVHHFMKQAQSLEEAQQLFQKHTERRTQLLEQVTAKRNELLHREPPKMARPSGEVRYERRMIALNNEQATRMEQENDKTLRRLAIQQLRAVYDAQKRASFSARVERQSTTHLDSVASARRKAQQTVEARTFESRARPPPEAQPIKNVEAHIQRAESLREAHRRQREEEARRLQEQVAKAHQNSEGILSQTVARAKQKVDDTYRRLSLIPPRVQEREQQLQARGSERDSLAVEKQRKVKETEEERIERERVELEGRFQRSTALLQKNSEEQQAKIAKEREDLERRNRAAVQIHEQLKQQREQTVRAIHQHQTEVELRLVEHEREKRTKVFERSCTHAEKSEEARRLAKMREMEAQREMREKVEQAAGVFQNLQAEKANSLARKHKAAMSFLERRAAVLEIHRTMTNMTEREMIEKLKDILAVDEMEAAEIVHAASQPRSLHES
jgi:hypothetical protein